MINQLAILRWVFLGRIAVALGIFIAVLTVWRASAWADTLIATLVLVLSIATTLVSVWYTWLYRGRIGNNFLYLQVIFDTLMVTAVVHLTGGPESPLAPLYILVIVAGALLLPIPGGILIGGLASILYFADIFWTATTDPPATALLQITLFAVMALVTGYVGDRLRRTGKMLGAVESELRQLRLDTGDILRTIDTGVVTVDAEGRLAYVNPAAEGILGIPSSQWLARDVLDLLDQRLSGLGETVRRTIATRVPVRWFETLSTDRPDRVFGVRTTTLERDGTPWATAVIQDITDAKQVEDLNRRTERLQAVAELSASMAHEIKNPLASIRSAVEQLTGGRLEGRDRKVLGDLVLSESDRLSRLLSQFIEFSRVEVRRTTPVDLAELCQEAITLARQHPDAGSDAEVRFDRPDGPLLVPGDSDLLHRVVYNLVLNGLQHAGPEGRVWVRTDAITGAEIPVGLDLRRAIRVAVGDSGPGVRPEDAARIFDPFFTTRKGGSGLGLALVHRAVEAHGGRILVGNGSHGGAEFDVYLPTVNGEAT